jgi:hypothetical protein
MGSYQREESTGERLDRNYGELLQELRVAQAGVQILFAFLLTIAFQQRFTELETYQRVFYGVTLTASALSAVLLIAPVAVHRALFRQGQKDEVVELSARLAVAGLALLAVAILAAVLFVLDVVWSLPVALAIGGTLTVAVVLLWVVVPLRARRVM